MNDLPLQVKIGALVGLATALTTFVSRLMDQRLRLRVRRMDDVRDQRAIDAHRILFLEAQSASYVDRITALETELARSRDQYYKLYERMLTRVGQLVTSNAQLELIKTNLLAEEVNAAATQPLDPAPTTTHTQPRSEDDYTMLPVYPQRSPAWAAHQLGSLPSATLGAYGCLDCCMASIATLAGHTITPPDFDEQALASGLFVSGDLLPDPALARIFPDVKLVAQLWYPGPADLQKIADLTSQGYKLILGIDFPHTGAGINWHFVASDASDPDTLVPYIMDPWYGDYGLFTAHYSDPRTVIQRVIVYTIPSTPPDAPAPTADVYADDAIKAYLEQLGTPVNMNTAIIQRAALAIKRDETRGPAISGEYPSSTNNHTRQDFTAGTADYDPETGTVSWVELNKERTV